MQCFEHSIECELDSFRPLVTETARQPEALRLSSCCHPLVVNGMQVRRGMIVAVRLVA